MFKKKSEDKIINKIPNEAIKMSEEGRTPVQTGNSLKKSRDPFNADRMSRDIPSDETVRTTKPDDTVFPG